MWWWFFKSNAQPTQEVDKFEELKNRRQFVNNTCDKLKGLKDENEVKTVTNTEENSKLAELKNRKTLLNRTCDKLAVLKKESTIKNPCANTAGKNYVNKTSVNTFGTCGNNEENTVAGIRKNATSGVDNLCEENDAGQNNIINGLDKCIKEEILKLVSVLEDKLQTVCTKVFRFML